VSSWSASRDWRCIRSWPCWAGRLPFEDERGQRRFVREHLHTHGDYVEAFSSAGLTVRRCIEPVLSSTELREKRRAFRHVPEATLAAYDGVPAVLIWDAEKA
jgi:hypothetical protein